MLDQGPNTRADFDRTLQALVGRSIEAVTYFEIAYEDNAPMWNRESDSFDSLDFGLVLRLDDGAVFSFTWGTEFTQYNVSIRRGQLALADTVREWDASERWHALLGVRIDGATSTWLPGDGADGCGDREYPQDIRLIFASGRTVTISAFESRDGDLNMGMMDHITVFFEEAEARQMVYGTNEEA